MIAGCDGTIWVCTSSPKTSRSLKLVLPLERRRLTGVQPSGTAAICSVIHRTDKCVSARCLDGTSDATKKKLTFYKLGLFVFLLTVFLLR